MCAHTYYSPQSLLCHDKVTIRKQNNLGHYWAGDKKENISAKVMLLWFYLVKGLAL